METEENIRKIIEEKINPSVFSHGGSVQLVSYEDGVCRLKLLGKCANCPSALQTLEEVIAPPLKEALPEVREVHLVQETDPELLDFARKILRHELI